MTEQITADMILARVGAGPGTAAQPPDSPTWARVDLTAYLDGTHTPQVPELFARSDGIRLLYRGRVHSLHGESESGKSWVALAAAAAELITGGAVLMLDFESDAATVVGRLLRLGVPPETIAERFDYRRPEADPDVLAAEQVAWSDLLGRRYTLAILDGVTEALAVYGVPSKDNDAVTGWIRATPRRLAAATGATVVLVDHVTKDADSRGRFAIGGQAKMAALDGAAYVVEVLNPLGVGLLGRVALRVAKDRPGGVRPHAGAWRKSDRTQEAAVVTIDSRETDRTLVTVDPPRTEVVGEEPGPRNDWKPTGLMERVSRALELAGTAMSRTGIEQTVTGKAAFVRKAVDHLLADGYVVDDGPRLNGGRPSIRLVKPYREGDEPCPDRGTGSTTPETPSATPSPSRSNDRDGGTGSPANPTPSPEQGGTGSGRGRSDDTSAGPPHPSRRTP